MMIARCPSLSHKQPLVVVLIRARIFEGQIRNFPPKILSRKALEICTHDARLVVFFVFSFCFWGFFVLVDEEPLLLLCFLVSIEFEAQSGKDEQQQQQQQQQRESVLVVGEFP
jgi:hypothetical protein